MSKKKKTNKKSNQRYLRRRRISPLKLVFWLTLALLAGFVVYNMYRFFFDKSYDLPSSPAEVIDSKKSEEKSKEKASEGKPDEAKKSDSSDGKDLKQNEGADPNSLETLTGSLTSATKSGDNLVIRVNIDQYLSSGACSLKLENSGTVVEKSASILPTASTSSCEGFDVPLSELDSGNWDIIIKLSSGEKTGEIKGEVSL